MLLSIETKVNTYRVHFSAYVGAIWHKYTKNILRFFNACSHIAPLTVFRRIIVKI